jgi:hypothetical protein
MVTKNDTLYGIFENNNRKLYFSKKAIDDIKGKYLGSEPFILPYGGIPIEKYGVLGVLVLCVSAVLIFFFIRKSKKNTSAKITFNRKTNEFEFKQKTITSFEENEKKVLHFLLEHPNKFVSLNQLNELFENSKQTETLSATIKRREQAVSSLIAKVAMITDIPESDLLLERKNAEDKRLKDVLLLPNLITAI